MRQKHEVSLWGENTQAPGSEGFLFVSLLSIISLKDSQWLFPAAQRTAEHARSFASCATGSLWDALDRSVLPELPCLGDSL